MNHNNTKACFCHVDDQCRGILWRNMRIIYDIGIDVMFVIRRLFYLPRDVKSSLQNWRNAHGKKKENIKGRSIRDWYMNRVHAEENKRRTLQRSDIATAISKTDMCDFLIDIVPREEAAKVILFLSRCMESEYIKQCYSQAQLFTIKTPISIIKVPMYLSIHQLR